MHWSNESIKCLLQNNNIEIGKPYTMSKNIKPPLSRILNYTTYNIIESSNTIDSQVNIWITEMKKKIYIKNKKLKRSQ